MAEQKNNQQIAPELDLSEQTRVPRKAGSTPG